MLAGNSYYLRNFLKYDDDDDDDELSLWYDWPTTGV